MEIYGKKNISPGRKVKKLSFYIQKHEHSKTSMKLGIKFNCRTRQYKKKKLPLKRFRLWQFKKIYSLENQIVIGGAESFGGIGHFKNEQSNISIPKNHNINVGENVL